MFPSNSNSIFPRLLTPEEAARYLGYSSTAILKKLPVKPIRIAIIGGKSAPRYDRYQLDALIDGLSGVERDTVTVGEADDEAGQALDAWMRRDEARRA